MDEWMLNDLLECSVCLERLDTSSKVLPCQHTFCKKCLEEIVESHKELRCPECRVLVDIGIEELPPNVLLMRILEGMKNAPKKRGSGVSRGHGTSSAPVHQHGVPHHQAHLAHQQQLQQQQSHHHHSSPAHAPVSKPSHEHSSPKQAILPGQPCARALYSYTSPESGDLTFKKGDLILLKKKIDANWFHGECSGNRGVFPSVYVEVLTPLPSPVPQCKALYDFRMTTDEEEGCLTFSKGEVINVIRRVDENWAEGKLGDRIGIFPLAFVELNQVARALMKLSTNSQPGPSRVAPPTPTSEETTPLIPIVEHHAAATAAQPASAVATTTQAPAAVAPRVLHRLGNSASSSSQTPSSSTTPNSSSTSCSSPSSTAPSSPASPPPQQQGDHPPLPHPRGTSSTSPLAQAPQQQQHREKRHSLNLLHAANPANIHRQVLLIEIETIKWSVSDQPAAQSGASASTTTSTAYAAASVLPALYVAMYPYKPQKADELELKKGALYLVTEKCQDGWFKGTAQGSHKSGVFPGNYVALAKSQSHGSSSASAGGGSRGGGGGVPRSNGHGGSSWNKSFNGGSSGAQQGRQSKGSGSHGNSSERPYMDLARSMLAAAQAAMHTVTTSQATASPVVSKPSVSTSGEL
ncbi:hypothetical protein B566_EDAN008049 [Ephemera danica]|nr:hypothetical protein B566_EDAN008049 [Ephemera danica]